MLVLEKGPWFTEQDFFKDELACCRRSVYTPRLADEPQVIEDRNRAGEWVAQSTADSGRDFWNGNCVGGSSNFMSGFFYRFKPVDFRPLAEFGPIEGANVADWPIDYDKLEPYCAMAEREVGISGRVVAHWHAEPRSTPDFPYPPTAEHFLAARIDAACAKLGFHATPTPRAILTRPKARRRPCEYSGYCGGCRFGDDPKKSALSRDCRLHDCDNVYVTDGSFLPNSGSVPLTWTIYANAFRVADRIVAALSQDVVSA